MRQIVRRTIQIAMTENGRLSPVKAPRGSHRPRYDRCWTASANSTLPSHPESTYSCTTSVSAPQKYRTSSAPTSSASNRQSSSSTRQRGEPVLVRNGAGHPALCNRPLQQAPEGQGSVERAPNLQRLHCGRGGHG